MGLWKRFAAYRRSRELRAAERQLEKPVVPGKDDLKGQSAHESAYTVGMLDSYDEGRPK